MIEMKKLLMKKTNQIKLLYVINNFARKYQ
jgi:hypothetical protein